MQAIFQSESTAALRRIPIYLVDVTDGSTPEEGIAFAAGEVKLSKNGAAEANHAGTFTELAGGLYYYEATAGELDTLGFLTVRVNDAAARQFVAVVQIVHPNRGLAGTALPAAAADAAGGVPVSDAGGLDLDAILVDTADMQPKLGTPADASLAADIAYISGKADALFAGAFSDGFLVADGAITATALAASAAEEIADAVWDEGTAGHVAGGSFGAQTAGILADTNELQTDWANGGRLDLIVDAILADTGTDGVPLTAAAVDAILDEVVEGATTLRQAVRLIVAAAVNKCSGGGTGTIVFRDLADTKARITTSVDASGNRTTVTLDGA